MYAAIAARKISALRAKVWRVAVMRSGWLTAAILAILLGGLILAVRERGKGDLARLEAGLTSKPTVQNVALLPPGGQEPIVLKRNATVGGGVPEFVSATLLPGRGMNMLQITASLPSRGEVPLLLSPSMDEASRRLSGAGSDSQGLASLSLGGAFEVPWAGRLGGVPTPDAENVMAVWQGQTLILPSAPRSAGTAGFAVGGLMLKRAADKIETTAVQDGWQSRSVYAAGGFDGHWVSQTEVTTQVMLSGQTMELGVTTKNIGPIPEPVGIGWRPHFVLPSGDRANATLRIPGEMRIETRAAGTGAGLPTGKLLPVAGTEYDFSKQPGERLGTRTLNENYVHLKRSGSDAGPVVELRDVTGHFGLRITMLSPSIKAIRVEAPSDQATVSIDPQFNYDDPFGKSWPKNEDTGIVVLQPGQSAEWKIRIELIPQAMQQASHF
jgi:aldose 1-epimerase